MAAACKMFDALVIHLLCVYCLSAKHIHNYSVPVNGSILFQCCENKNQILWEFQGDLLFIAGFLIREDFSTNLFLLQNSSLYINPISLHHIGKYECFKEKVSVSTFFIDVEAPPTVSIWVNNYSYYSNGDAIYLPFNESVHVSCYATGSRPAVNVSIMVDSKDQFRTDSYTTTNIGLDGISFDTRTTVLLHTTRESGNVSCQSSSLTYYSERRLSAKYFTYEITMVEWTSVREKKIRGLTPTFA